MISIEKCLDLVNNENYKVCVFGCGHLGVNVAPGLLANLGFQIDFYCDNNESLWGKEITNGIFCVSLDRLVETSQTICFLIMRSDYIQDVKQQLEELGVDNIILYQDILEQPGFIERFFALRKQVAVYTCVVGDYDHIIDPEFISDSADYYYISDKKPMNKTVFSYIDIRDILEDKELDLTRQNRYCKINAHKVFPDYKYSVYIDGNIVLKKSLKDFITNLPKSRLAVAGEAYTDDLYNEAARCVLAKRDDESTIRAQIVRYWNEGMPRHFGSALCNVLVREHNNPRCIKLMEDWWNEVENNSCRDQISFGYILWKNGYTINDVLKIVPDNAFDSPYWDFIHEHTVHRVSKNSISQ